MKLSSILAALLLILLFTAPLAAGELHVNDLIESSRSQDGQRVEITGEAIGDIMMRGGMGWVNILDQGTAIGIWATPEQLKEIRTLGSYNNVGDTVTVVGTFQRACSEHGGELDIHAEQIIINQVGSKTAHPIQRDKLVLSVILLPLTLAIVWYDRQKNRFN